MTHPQTAHWFDGTGEVFNERAIIGGQLKTSRRPDRVIFYPDDGHIEVIDYKSGRNALHTIDRYREYMSCFARWATRISQAISAISVMKVPYFEVSQRSPTTSLHNYKSNLLQSTHKGVVL